MRTVAFAENKRSGPASFRTSNYSRVQDFNREDQAGALAMCCEAALLFPRTGR